MEDLLDAKFGKHDYDWLLVPHETPLVPHLDDIKDRPLRATPNGRTRTRSVSTARASRLSAPHSENITSTKPVRSNSVTRPSISQPRSSTPVRTRPPSTSTGVKTAEPQINSRPSTPTSRPQILISPNPNTVALVPRSNSRPSVGQIPTPTARPGSPGPRARPKMRAKLPERPCLAGRACQGLAMTASENSNVDLNRRHSLPVVSQVKFPETSDKVKICTNGHNKVATTTDNSLRHMDIRQGMGIIRGASVFPHSVRSSTLKCRPAHKPDRVVPVPVMTDKVVTENGICNGTNPPSKLDLYASYRYDAMLLKEDSKNMSRLHSTEENSDQCPLFDHRYEPLPEPFGIL